MDLLVYKCASYSTAIGYDLPKSYETLNNYFLHFDSRRFKEVVVFFDAAEEGEQCVLVFSYGIVIFWGFKNEEECNILDSLKGAEIRSMEFAEFEKTPIALIQEDSSKIKVCGILLDKYGYKHKLAFSFAAAQSLKVHCYEMTVESSAGDMHFLSESLSNTGTVSMSRKQMSKKIGEVFLKKNMINLSSETIDVPEVIWDNDDLENIYDAATVYFDVASRVNTLNKRLDTMSDLLLLLSEELRYRSSSRTELIIVGLILIEVIIAIAEFYLYKIR